MNYTIQQVAGYDAIVLGKVHYLIVEPDTNYFSCGDSDVHFLACGIKPFIEKPMSNGNFPMRNVSEDIKSITCKNCLRSLK